MLVNLYCTPLTPILEVMCAKVSIPRTSHMHNTLAHTQTHTPKACGRRAAISQGPLMHAVVALAQHLDERRISYIQKTINKQSVSGSKLNLGTRSSFHKKLASKLCVHCSLIVITRSVICNAHLFYTLSFAFCHLRSVICTAQLIINTRRAFPITLTKSYQ